MTIRHVDSYLWAVHITVSWAMPCPPSKETAETVIEHLSKRALIRGVITSQRKVGLVGIYRREENEVSQQQQVTVHGVWHVAWQRYLLVGTQRDPSYTEHRPPSNHQPVTRVFTASAVCPITCTQLLADNSKRRQ